MIINLLLFIVFVTTIALLIQKIDTSHKTVKYAIKKNYQAKLLFAIILLGFFFFSALRTTYNDTTTYRQGFSMVDTSVITIKTMFEPYGGFTLFQQLLKTFVTDDPQILMIASAAICVPLTLRFIVKYSEYFGESIYWYATGSFMFSMAGIKQAIAISIGLLFVEFIYKRKYIIAIIFLMLATTFHPYVICLAVIPFLRDDVLGMKTMGILILAVLLISNLDKLLGLIATMGKEYDISEFYGNTINPFRLIIESLPVLIIVIFRQNLKRENDELLNMGCNMIVVNFACLCMGMILDPIYMGRIALYFSAISAVTTPQILNCALKNQKYRSMIKIGYYIIFTLYFILNTTQLGSLSLFTNIFWHISFLDLFKL